MLKKIDHCNVEAMIGVRDVILTAPPETFNMAKYCGTACCIAGHAVIWAGKEIQPLGTGSSGRDILGLSGDTAEALFLPSGEDLDWHEITPAHAAQAMDNVILHDDPKWDEVMG